MAENPDDLFFADQSSDSIPNTTKIKRLESDKKQESENSLDNSDKVIELSAHLYSQESLRKSDYINLGYVSLHNHTNFSILDSISKPVDLFKRAKELGQSAVAITDHGSLAGLWDSLKASRDTGVKLIPGCECYFIDDVCDKSQEVRHIILLSKNEIGYKNLLLTLAEGFDNSILANKKVYPLIDWNILKKYSEGIICTTACGNGILSQLINHKEFDRATEQSKRLQDIYGDNLAIELQAHALKRISSNYSSEIDQRFTNLQLRKIAESLGIKCIVTTDSHYINPGQHESHDVLLAIASSQPLNSGARLKYNVPDFYFKSEEEIFTKLKRLMGNDEEFVKNCIENTKFFADQCLMPDWIETKYSNPSGKELPDFPVKEQKDYGEFLEWRRNNSKYDNLEEDKVYLRYKCELAIPTRIKSDNLQVYLDRIEEELDVLYYCGVSSYMLIVADYVEWSLENGIPVGPGRGCLTKDSLVLTDHGYVHLDQVNVGDYVYTHTGSIRKVFNKFKYNINEEGLKINSEFSFNPTILTKDHKVFAYKAIETDKYVELFVKKGRVRWVVPTEPSWIEAKDLKVNDLVFMPFLTRDNIIDTFENIDLSQFIITELNYEISCDKIIQKIPKNNNLSIRSITKHSNLDRDTIKRIKYNKIYNNSSFKKVSNYLLSIGTDINDWVKNDNCYTKTVDRFIKLDKEWWYILGRWIGDGWTFYNKNHSYVTGFAFNSDDQKGITKVYNYFNNLGYDIDLRKATNGKKLVQLIIRGKPLYNLFMYFISDYKHKSNTKHLPALFRNFNDENLSYLLNGLFDSDGHIEIYRENFDTTSLRLALEVKEALLYLHIPSSINTRKSYKHPQNENYLCKESYKIRFKGLSLDKSTNKNINKTGYFCKILNIEPVLISEVYDISVDKDTSYLTCNSAVHNSAGGSLVAYLLNIHQCDPIKYGLIFARFHNKLKDSYSDIDLDFSQDGKPRVEEYLRQKYGVTKVAHVGNYIFLKPKMYAKYMAKTYMLGGDRKSAIKMGDALADTISGDVKSLKTLMDGAPLFAEYAKQYPELANHLNDFANVITGQGMHASGIVIGNRDLLGLVPIRKDKENIMLLEYEKERTEENGLVKMDILGLSTLDIIKDIYKLIKKCGKEVMPFDYNGYDEKTYDLIGSGNLFGVFQFGTSGNTINLCKRYQPRNMEDLALITTLARPNASKEVREKFFQTKEGKLPVTYLHPLLESSFKNTLGFALYDESLLTLAKSVANWDLNAADRLRKLTKEKGKHPENAKKWKKDFIEGAMNNNVDKKIAEKIWTDIVEPYAKYSFNKSHAVAYSFISYHTAWLKANYPLEFLVANLKSEVNSNAKIAADNISKIKEEIRHLNVNIIPPDLNKSEGTYTIIDNNTILTGFDALKHIGKNSIPEIISKRPFQSFEDFLGRVDAHSVNAKSIQALAAAGCLDGFGMTRKQIYLYSSDYKKKLQQYLKNKEKKPEKYTSFDYPWPEVGEFTVPEKFALETLYIGEGLSGNKFNIYPGFFSQNPRNFKDLINILPPPPSDMTEKDMRKYTEKVIDIQCILKSYFEFKIKKEGDWHGKIMCKAIIEDPFNNRMSLTIFPTQLNEIKEKCKFYSKIKDGGFSIGCALRFSGNLNWYNGELCIIMDDLYNFADPPQLPLDLDHKKVSMKLSKKEKEEEKAQEEKDRNEFLEEVEEELIQNGDADLEEDDGE